MNNKYRVGRRVSSLERYADVGPITAVALLLDDGNEIVAGDTTGYTLEIDCPYGTETMANNLLASLSGKTYKGYRATGAILNPAAELGDGITVDGEYSFLAYQNITCGPGHMSETAAPGESYSEHEYGYKTPTQRQTDRKIAQTNSRISKTSEQIMLEVNKKTTEDEAKALIKAAIDEIELTVSSANGTTTFKLTSDEAELSTKTLNLSVDAANITGKLTASQIDADELVVRAANIGGTLTADQIVLTDSISWADLSSEVQGEINDAWWMAYGAEQDFASMTYTYQGKTYIDESMIMAGTIIAGSLMGGSVSLLDADENTAGVITITDATTADFAVDITSNGGLRLNGLDGDSWLGNGGGQYLHLQADAGTVTVGNADLRPNGASVSSCGTASFPWSDVYATNAEIQTSDRNKKTDIVYGLDYLDAVFDGLLPASFLFKNGTSGRRHPGLIAQDVEELLNTLGVDSLDFSPFIKSPRKDENGTVVDGEYEYALRYGELISLCIDQIQKLKRRVIELEAKV